MYIHAHIHTHVHTCADLRQPLGVPIMYVSLIPRHPTQARLKNQILKSAASEKTAFWVCVKSHSLWRARQLMSITPVLVRLRQNEFKANLGYTANPSHT